MTLALGASIRRYLIASAVALVTLVSGANAQKPTSTQVGCIIIGATGVLTLDAIAGGNIADFLDDGIEEFRTVVRNDSRSSVEDKAAIDALLLSVRAVLDGFDSRAVRTNPSQKILHLTDALVEMINMALFLGIALDDDFAGMEDTIGDFTEIRDTIVEARTTLLVPYVLSGEFDNAMQRARVDSGIRNCFISHVPHLLSGEFETLGADEACNSIATVFILEHLPAATAACGVAFAE
ncbi:MAG: hypothetical protein GDA52_00460 [Rhodobacteraceae bacterium]|nr:hypothetical protein [Paracoccaceae bacterium]